MCEWPKAMWVVRQRQRNRLTTSGNGRDGQPGVVHGTSTRVVAALATRGVLAFNLDGVPHCPIGHVLQHATHQYHCGEAAYVRVARVAIAASGCITAHAGAVQSAPLGRGRDLGSRCVLQLKTSTWHAARHNARSRFTGLSFSCTPVNIQKRQVVERA